MKNKSSRLILYSICLIIFSCKSKLEKYEIIDKKVTTTNNAMFIVYTPDTNWVEMETKAKELIKPFGKYSAVGFFHPKDKVPKLKENGAVPGWAWDYIISNYRFIESQGKFIMNKSPNRLRRDMKF